MLHTKRMSEVLIKLFKICDKENKKLSNFAFARSYALITPRERGREGGGEGGKEGEREITAL